MTDLPLTTKLGIGPGHRLLVLNPLPDYLARLAPLPDGVTVQTAGAGPFDCVLVFVHRRSQVDILAPLAIRVVAPEGRLWFSYPKGSPEAPTDVDREAGWDRMTAAGYEGEAQVSLDETWSALRFRRCEASGATAPSPAAAPASARRARGGARKAR